jgi:hypothetical protein
VALTFKGERVTAIHDFLFARYAMDGVDLLRWAARLERASRTLKGWCVQPRTALEGICRLGRAFLREAINALP